MNSFAPRASCRIPVCVRSRGDDLLVEDPLPSRGFSVLDRDRAFISHVELVTALGASDLGPVGGSAAGSVEPRALAEDLKGDRAQSVAVLPIIGKATLNQGKDARFMDPQQHQEPRVVDNEGQVAAAGFGGPPGEPVPWSDLPGCGAEGGERHAVGGACEVPLTGSVE